MKRESQETWAKRVERWQDCGLTSEAFCSEAGFNPRTLKYWKWRLGKAARSDAASARQGGSVLSKPAMVYRDPKEAELGRLQAALTEAEARADDFERKVDGLEFGNAALRRRLAEAKEDQLGPRLVAWSGFGVWVGAIPAMVLGAATQNIHMALVPVFVGGLAGSVAAYFRGLPPHGDDPPPIH